MRKASLNLVYIVLFFLISAANLYPQQDVQDNILLSDTVFTEIILNKNGVEAYDSLGNKWFYDFQNEIFVRGERDIRDTERRREDRKDDVELSIEQRCTEKIKIKTLSKSATVGYDEYVNGDIIVTGRVSVKGWVKGDITSLNGRVLVSQSGRVDGDIAAPDIIVRDGGIVLGNQIISGSPLNIENIGIDFSIDGIIIVLSISAFFVMLSFIILALMPQKQQNISNTIENNKIKTTLFGFILIPLLPVFLSITIVGIVLLIFIPFLYLIAFAMGLNYLGDKIGRTLSLRLFNSEKSVYFQTFLGFVILISMWVITAVLLSIDQQPAFGFGIFFLVFSILITSYSICAGMGAVALTRFGFKKYTSWKEQRLADSSDMAPAPPPIPNSPDNNLSGLSPHFKKSPPSASDEKSNPPPPPQSPTPPDNL